MEAAPFVRVADARRIYISSAMSDALPSEADLYQSGKVFALVGREPGEYHLNTKSGGRRAKYLCSMGAVSLLLERFGDGARDQLPAWTDRWGKIPVVLFSDFPSYRPFDESFQPVLVPYQKWVPCRVLVERNALLFPAKVMPPGAEGYAVYARGEALLLRPAQGEAAVVRAEARSNSRYVSLDCLELTELCRQRFGPSSRLRALATRSGVLLADREEALTQAAAGGRAKPLDLCPTQRLYLTLNCKWEMYLSAEAGRRLEGRVAAVECGRLLALRRDDMGGLTVRNKSRDERNRFILCSKAFKERILMFYPQSKKLYMVPYGRLFLLTADGRPPFALPREEDFRPIVPAKADARCLPSQGKGTRSPLPRAAGTG